MTGHESHATLGNVGKNEPNETLPAAPGAAAQTLPFVRPAADGGVGAIACCVLGAPDDSAPVPVALDALLWRSDAALRMSVVAKASFSMAAPMMTPADVPEPLRASDVHHKNQPMAHVIASSDRVPWKARVDVTVLGHAHAPKHRAITEMKARFALMQGDRAVIDRMVRVVGDRDAPNAAPAPFVKMPIVYERAYGGSAAPANPIGCGEEDDDQPNILDPGNPWRPAGFGPISAAWPLRQKRLGDTPRRNLDASVMDLPAGFDPAYFQSAAQEQQIAELAPNAVVVLEGFDPEREHIEVALPGARAVGAVYGLDTAEPDAPSELVFRADTLHIDADRWLCTITFRASVDVRVEAALGGLLVAAGVGACGREPSIPSARPRTDSAPLHTAAPLAQGEPRAAAATGTIDLHSARSPSDVTLPFGTGAGTRPWTPSGADAQALVLSPPGAATPSARLNERPLRKPSDFFHDLSKLREASGIVPRAKDDAAPAKTETESPEEAVDIERCGRIAAALAEPSASLDDVLAANEVDESTWRKAERHWRRAMESEIMRGERALRDRFDEAYVRAWEAEHPDGFDLARYARLVWAEQKGRLLLELGEQGLDTSLGMRLQRVWQKRAATDKDLSAKIAEALAKLD